MPAGQRLLAGPVVVSAPFRTEQVCRRRQAEPQQRAQRLETVPPGQLLALVSRPGVIADWNFVYAVTQKKDPCGDVGLNIEPAAAEVEPLPKVRPERFVTRLQVGQI